MTYEHKIVVSLDEIRAVVFECNTCKSRTAISPANLLAIPENCPNGHLWQRTGLGHTGAWVTSLKHFSDPVYEKSGFKILLEFEEPKS